MAEESEELDSDDGGGGEVGQGLDSDGVHMTQDWIGLDVALTTCHSEWVRRVM